MTKSAELYNKLLFIKLQVVSLSMFHFNHIQVGCPWSILPTYRYLFVGVCVKKIRHPTTSIKIKRSLVKKKKFRSRRTTVSKR